jgi:hypothetical protein
MMSFQFYLVLKLLLVPQYSNHQFAYEQDWNLHLQ